jgi:predicted nucleic acid-binding protein
MKTYIIDASFILSSLFLSKEHITRKLKTILQEQEKREAEIYTTDYFLLEVANGLRFSLKDACLTLEVWDKISLLPLKYFSFNKTHIKEILTHSYDFKTTVYDTSYHYLAKLLSGTFLTCDKNYYQNAKSWDNIELVE